MWVMARASVLPAKLINYPSTLLDIYGLKGLNIKRAARIDTYLLCRW